VGMAAVFGVAANAPLSLSVMAVEILGAAVLPHVLLVMTFAWLFTGHRSIYSAQRVHFTKGGRALPALPRITELPGLTDLPAAPSPLGNPASPAPPEAQRDAPHKAPRDAPPDAPWDALP